MTGGVGRRGRAASLLAAALVATATPAAGLLESLRWERRVLLLFAPAPGDPRLAPLEAALAARACEVEERDLVAVHVETAAVRVRGAVDAPAGAAAAMRERFGIAADDAQVVLVGKDGGEKLRAAQPELGAIFALIDGMPMRRREMREDGGGCAPPLDPSGDSSGESSVERT